LGASFLRDLIVIGVKEIRVEEFLLKFEQAGACFGNNKFLDVEHFSNLYGCELKNFS
jgi:hypothetical protein